jgi:hypothetical protein
MKADRILQDQKGKSVSKDEKPLKCGLLFEKPEGAGRRRG